jgi:hypothetical protein
MKPYVYSVPSLEIQNVSFPGQTIGPLPILSPVASVPWAVGFGRACRTFAAQWLALE